MKKKITILAVLVFALASISFGQSKASTINLKGQTMTLKENFEQNFSQGSEFRVRRTVDLENDSKAEEIYIEISENTIDFNLKIEGRIRQGKLLVEIYDSAGKKQGNFTIETQMDSDKKEEVNGQFRKTWKNVPKGQWTVKIIPTKATAKVMITSAFFNN